MCLIGDEDTVTGFLLAGIGEVDASKNSNFLVVTPSNPCACTLSPIQLQLGLPRDADQQSCVSRTETPANQIEEAFKAYTARDDVAVVMITQV